MFLIVLWYNFTSNRTGDQSVDISIQLTNVFTSRFALNTYLELVEILLGCAEVGYPKTVKEVRAMVGKIVAKKQHQDFRSTASASHGWREKFQKRHQELSFMFQ